MKTSDNNLIKKLENIHKFLDEEAHKKADDLDMAIRQIKIRFIQMKNEIMGKGK